MGNPQVPSVLNPYGGVKLMGRCPASHGHGWSFVHDISVAGYPSLTSAWSILNHESTMIQQHELSALPRCWVGCVVAWLLGCSACPVLPQQLPQQWPFQQGLASSFSIPQAQHQGWRRPGSGGGTEHVEAKLHLRKALPDHSFPEEWLRIVSPANKLPDGGFFKRAPKKGSFTN